MLPLLPALILFLLNGPANIERLAEGGALPAMLAAIQQRIDAQPVSHEEARRGDSLALASLLSLSADPRVSHALVRILVLGVDACPPHDCKPPALASRPEPPAAEESIGRPHSGYLRSQRSRDGPCPL
jgi:hypothetical protein